MGQQRKRPAAGMHSNRSKQSKTSEKLVTNSRQGESEPVSNDLFDDVDQDMFVDAAQEATKDVQDQTDFSDNEEMTDELQEMEEPKSLLDAPDVAKRFRDFYMTQLTQAFPNDLDKIRQEENFDHNKLEILIDSLEAGVDIFSDMEKSFAIMSS
ncbi:hypothetical protein Unana1_01654 [Umbelopsis nana]